MAVRKAVMPATVASILNAKLLARAVMPEDNHRKIGVVIGFVENLLLSAGLLLVLLGALEIAQVPIYVAGRYMPFKIGSLITPYLIIVTVSPLILEKPSGKTYASILLMLVLLVLTDLAAGYYYSVAVSMALWSLVVFLCRKRLGPRQIHLSFLILLIAYTGLTGLSILVKPLIPLELTPLNWSTDVLWRTYLVLAWPAILAYSLLPYALLSILVLTSRRKQQFLKTDYGAIFKEEAFTKRMSRILLTASTVLAVYVSIYNYYLLKSALGVDVPHYAAILEKIVNSGSPLIQAFSEPQSSTRPLYMLFLYSIHRLTGLTPMQTAETAPAILMPVLVLSYYVLAKRFFKTESMGALTAILAIAGIQFPVGLYASYQANILGLAIGNLLASVALTVNDKRVSWPLASLLSFSGMLVHSWTAICYFTAIIAALAYHAAKSKNIESMMMVVIIIASALSSKPFVQAVQQPVEGSTNPLHAAQATVENTVSIGNLDKYWSNTLLLFTNWCRGFMANFFLYMLAILGITRLHSIPGNARIFLAMFLLELAPLPFTDHVVASRIAFNIPLQVYASMAIYPLLQGGLGKKLLGASLGLLSLNYSIFALANM